MPPAHTRRSGAAPDQTSPQGALLRRREEKTRGSADVDGWFVQSNELRRRCCAPHHAAADDDELSDRWDQRMRTRGSTYLWLIIKYPAGNRWSCPANCRNVVWGVRTWRRVRGFRGWTPDLKFDLRSSITLTNPFNLVLYKTLSMLLPANMFSEDPNFCKSTLVNILYQPNN